MAYSVSLPMDSRPTASTHASHVFNALAMPNTSCGFGPLYPNVDVASLRTANILEHQLNPNLPYRAISERNVMFTWLVL